MPEKKCFVLGPFGEPGDEKRAWFMTLLEQVIDPALGDDYKVVDTLRTPEAGNVLARILSLLEEADVVVADLTFSRPSVFYELGYRHALGKPCVLMRKHGEPTPFDLGTHEIISVEARDDQKRYFLSDTEGVKRNLKQQVNAAGQKGVSLGGLSHEVHRARFFEWTIAYSPTIATDWLQQQPEEIRKAIEQYEGGGGLDQGQDRRFLRKFGEYLEFKKAASQLYEGKLFYIVNIQSGELVFGYGLFKFPPAPPILIDATGAEADGASGHHALQSLSVTFRQPSRHIDVLGASIELTPYKYSVEFSRRNPRSRRLYGVVQHPDTKTAVGDTELVPFAGQLG